MAFDGVPSADGVTILHTQTETAATQQMVAISIATAEPQQPA
jgi:hypothetical protein